MPGPNATGTAAAWRWSLECRSRSTVWLHAAAPTGSSCHPGSPTPVVSPPPLTPGRLTQIRSAEVGRRTGDCLVGVAAVGAAVREPSHRRRGVARLALRALLNWFVEQDIAVIDVYASEQAQALYLDLGFTAPYATALRWRG